MPVCDCVIKVHNLTAARLEIQTVSPYQISWRFFETLWDLTVFKMRPSAIMRFLNSNFWAIISKKGFALCYQTVVSLSVCLSVLSVCNVRALWPNGWTDQDDTWRAGRARPWPHCISWGPSSPSPNGAQPPIFGIYLLRPNGCMDQDVTSYGARPRPGDFVLDGDPAPLPKRGAEPPPNFRPMFIVAKRLDG